MIISVVGNSGSGKTQAAKFISEMDSSFYILSLDDVMRKTLIENTNNKLILRAKKEATDKNGNIKLGGLLLKRTKEDLDELETVLVKESSHLIKEFVEKHENVVIEGTAGCKTQYFDKSKKILIECDDSKRVQQAMARDLTSPEIAEARKQNKRDYKAVKFDYIIKNNSGLDELREQTKCCLDTAIML